MWDPVFGEHRFKISVMNAESCIKGKLFGMKVIAAIYLGDILLCKPEETRLVPASDKPSWDQPLEFDMKLKNIPRNARLCMSLYGLWGNPLKVLVPRNPVPNLATHTHTPPRICVGQTRLDTLEHAMARLRSRGPQHSLISSRFLHRTVTRTPHTLVHTLPIPRLSLRLTLAPARIILALPRLYPGSNSHYPGVS